MNNKSQKVLTISIAAYNVEKYLEKCLSSFVIEEVLDDIEVLIIDDGSKDNTAQIARKYEGKYKGTFRLIQKENGGHGSTVNRGMQEAAGKYFKTVDGDDWVDKEGFVELVSYLKTAEEDLIVTDYWQVESETEKKIKKISYEFKDRITKKNYRFDQICDKVYVNMHGAAYRTSILKEMPERLDEHCFYVDAEYMLYPIPYIQTICFLETSVYMYRLGTATQSMEIHNMQKNCRHHEKVLEQLLAFYNRLQDGISKEKRGYIARGVARILVSQMKIYLSYPSKDIWKQKIAALDDRIRKNYPEIYFSVNNTAIKILRKSNYIMYQFISKLCRIAYKC